MQSAEKSRSGWLRPASLLALALLFLAGCASSAAKPPEEGGKAAPALSAPPAPEAAEGAPAPSATTIAETAPGEAQASPVEPLLSGAGRLAPPGTGLLVLGLPEPSLPPAEVQPPVEAPLTAAAAMAAPEPPPPEPAPAADSALPSEAPALAPAPATQPAPAPAGGGPASALATAPASIKPPPAPLSPPALRTAPAPQASAPQAPTVQPAPAPKPLPPETATPAPAPATAPLALLPFVDPNGSPATPRSFTVELGQGLDLPFSGTGWTYLGEKNGREGLRYVSRRFSEGGVLFSLLTTAPGEFSLRFQRQDLLKGQSLEELVTVLVRPKVEPAVASAPALATPASGAAVTGAAQSAGAVPSAGATAAVAVPAPSAPAVAAPAPGAAPAAGGASSGAAVAAPALGALASPSPSLPDSPEELLRLARTEFGAGHAAETLAALERFLALYPIGMDEVYLLLGRARELNGPYRDVKKAYEAYKKLSEDYPQSQFWNDAVERLAYIERHYFEIR